MRTTYPPPEGAEPLVIVEPDSSGHRFYYVALLCKHADGRRIVLVTSESAHRSDEFRVHLSALADRLEVRTFAASGTTQLHRLRLRSKALASARRLDLPGAVLVFPELDLFLLPWMLNVRAWRMSSRASALLMKPLDHARRGAAPGDRAIRVGKALSLMLLQRSGLRAYQLVDAFGHRQQPLERGLASLSDPAGPGSALSREEARRATQLPLERGIVLLAGNIDERKGVNAVLDALALLDPERVLLVIAGAIEAPYLRDPQMRALTARGLLEVREGYLDNEQLNEHLRASDVVLVVRRADDSPSGLLAQAAARGRVVVTAGSVALAKTVVDRDLGLASGDAPEELAATIMDALARQGELEARARVASEELEGSEQRFAEQLLTGR